MMRVIKWILSVGLLAGGLGESHAFSLLGRFKNGANGAAIPWQGTGFGGRPQGLGYQLQGDHGGPMNPLEAYRWNVPTITYAFDSTFLRYFGTNGVNAVEQAIAILNAVPAASKMSSTLTEFPLDATGVNQDAQTLGLLDLKSTALFLLMGELGLADPERFVWNLRDRVVIPAGGTSITNYTVIQLNYDPVTLRESRYVNGVLYNYLIVDDLGPQGNEWASAVEWYQLDPLFFPYSSIAGSGGTPDGQLGSSPDPTSVTITGLIPGRYFRGLTRDDAGGLRFLLSTNNFAVESLLPDVFGNANQSSGASPWVPFPGFTNATGTNVVIPTNGFGLTNLTNFVRTALRPGRDKVTFQRVAFDSVLGATFTPLTNSFKDTFINPTNGKVTTQKLQRVILQPDILFGVDDLGTDPLDGLPFLTASTDTTRWSNNAALNSALVGVRNLGGPGVITPGIQIIFSDLVPYYENQAPGNLESDGFLGLIWGSYDGTATPPVVYPVFQHPLLPDLSLQYLQSQALVRRNR